MRSKLTLCVAVVVLAIPVVRPVLSDDADDRHLFKLSAHYPDPWPGVPALDERARDVREQEVEAHTRRQLAQYIVEVGELSGESLREARASFRRRAESHWDVGWLIATWFAWRHGPRFQDHPVVGNTYKAVLQRYLGFVERGAQASMFSTEDIEKEHDFWLPRYRAAQAALDNEDP